MHRNNKYNTESLPPHMASRREVLLSVLTVACALVFLAHLPVLRAQALSFDDSQYLSHNVLVRNPGWDSTRRFLTEILEPSTVRGYYQPLTMISLMVDYALGGRPGDLGPFHLTSLALHITNTALVIVLLYMLFGQSWIAAGAGLLFGLHPMSVESIAWVGERKTLLAALFALWSLILYVRFARKGGWKLFVGCVTMYVLALMSKPTSIPLPLLMLLMDHWPLKRIGRHAILEKLPLCAIGGVFAVITYISQARTATVSLPGEYGPGRILLILCHNIVFYLHKIVWPADLSCYYGYPEPLALSHPMVLAGILGTSVLIPLLLISLRWTRALLTGWLIFFVAVLPAIGVIGFARTIAADRHAYLPVLGLLMTLTAAIAWFCDVGRARMLRCVFVAAVLLVLGYAESVATRKYLGHWVNTVTLHEYMLAITPDAASIHTNLAVTLDSWGRTDEAIKHFRRAVQIDPDSAQSQYNLGSALRSLGTLEEAVGHYRRALQLKPDLTAAHYGLGLVLWSLDKHDEAIHHYRQALRLGSDRAEVHRDLGIALAKTGRPDEAMACLRQAVRLNPQSPMFLADLAWILATSSDPEVRDANEAVNLATRAAEMTGHRSSDVLDSLAAAHAASGDFVLAVTTAESALLWSRPDDYRKSLIHKRLELYRRGRPYRENLSD